MTNIEGCEHRRRRNATSLSPPEHPRSCTTDDVECFFSVIRDTIGKNFTVKEVKHSFKKIVIEFLKRLNPELPFFYHTSTHVRFREGPLASFNEPSSDKPRRKHARPPRREQPAVFAPGRASMPVRGSLSVRAQFHNQPVELPPPPNASYVSYEHSYGHGH